MGVSVGTYTGDGSDRYLTGVSISGRLNEVVWYGLKIEMQTGHLAYTMTIVATHCLDTYL